MMGNLFSKSNQPPKNDQNTSERSGSTINWTEMHADSHPGQRSFVTTTKHVQLSQTRRHTTSTTNYVTTETVQSSGSGRKTSVPTLTYTPVYTRPTLSASADASPIRPAIKSYNNSKPITVANPPAVHKNEYDLSKNAYVLIFHHDTFKESRYNREGSAEDMKKIKQTLQKYRCDKLDINENLTCSSVLKKMDKISTQNFSNNSCLIVFILSHGNVNDTIMAQDGYMYSFHSDIVEQCTSNKTLKNKPKIFVLQACRGDATIVTDATRSLSNKIDIVAFQSSYLGTVSYRDKRKGSFFMQAFLRLLDEHNQQSIININTLLNREFNEEGILQTPTLMTTLQKELIFGKLLRKR